MSYSEGVNGRVNCSPDRESKNEPLLSGSSDFGILFSCEGALGCRQNPQGSCLGGSLGAAVDPKFSIDIASMRFDRIE